MLKRLVFLLLAVTAAPAAADQAPVADSGPKIALPHNCISYYPEAALRADAEGTAVVAFSITAGGLVKASKIAKSSGNADLDAASLQCVSGWQYVPAKRGGVAVEAPWQAAVQWKLHGGSDYRMMAHCASFHALTAAMFTGIPGVTVLTYRVMPNGTLSDLAVSRSSGDKSLDDAALSCLRGMRYNAEELDIPAEGIPGHALMDWQSEYRRGVPLAPPYPPGLTPPILLPGKPCEAMAHVKGPAHDGVTAVDFTVATDGSVHDVTLAQSSGNPALDKAMTTCAAGWYFSPANDGGVPYAIKWGFKMEWRAGQPPADVNKL
jgi:periplasmic protein TonB